MLDDVPHRHHVEGSCTEARLLERPGEDIETASPRASAVSFEISTPDVVEPSARARSRKNPAEHPTSRILPGRLWRRTILRNSAARAAWARVSAELWDRNAVWYPEAKE